MNLYITKQEININTRMTKYVKITILALKVLIKAQCVLVILLTTGHIRSIRYKFCTGYSLIKKIFTKKYL